MSILKRFNFSLKSKSHEANNQKIEKFFLTLSNHLRNLFSKDSFLLASLVFIVLSSIFLRYQIDIGTDSAIYFDVAERLIDGQKFNQDFTEINSPLNFFIYAIPVYFAKIANFNSIPVVLIFVDLLGILSLLFSNRVLRKAQIFEDKILFNILIISCGAAFFWRYQTIEFNEYATKSSLFLACIMPYFCYYLPRKNDANLNYFEKISHGILMALIVGLKPNYVIIPLVLESYRAFQARSFKSLFRLTTYLALALFLLYIVSLFIFVPEYVDYVIFNDWNLYYGFTLEFNDWIKQIFYKKIFLLMAFILILLTRLPRSKINNFFIIFATAFSLTFFSERLFTSDQTSIFYGLSIIVMAKLFYDMLKNNLFNWRDLPFNQFLLLLIILYFVDPNFKAVPIFLVKIWFVIMPFFLFFLAKNNQEILPSFKTNFFISALAFLTLAIIAVAYFFDNLVAGFVAILLGALAYEACLRLNKNKPRYFSRPASFLIIAIFLYFVTGVFDSLRNVYQKNNDAINPNNLSEAIESYIGKYARNDSIFIISSWNYDTYPLVKYAPLNKENYVASSFFKLIGLKNENIRTPRNIGEGLRNIKENWFLIHYLNNQTHNGKAKLIFINNDLGFNMDGGLCYIGFLEYYLIHNQVFADNFFKNYVFLNRIIFVKPTDNLIKDSDLFKLNKINQIIKPNQKYQYDFDVYIRRKA